MLKKLLDTIENNFILNIIYHILCIPIMLFAVVSFGVAPYFIMNDIFDIQIFDGDFRLLYCLLMYIIYFAILFFVAYIVGEKNFPILLTLFSLFIGLEHLYHINFEHNNKNVSGYKQQHIKISSNDNFRLNSNNNNSSYIEKYSSDKNNISSVEKNENEIFKSEIQYDNNISKYSSHENYLEDNWEFVTDDEFGNKYYINKNYSVIIFDSPLEGKIFSVEFKKVLKNGYYVDVPALDKNYKMTTEKKYLSHEEYIVHFRNENGFKEFKISVITGYDENDSVIIGYGSTQMKDFMKWKSVNNTLYNELYEAAYSRLK